MRIPEGIMKACDDAPIPGRPWWEHTGTYGGLSRWQRRFQGTLYPWDACFGAVCQNHRDSDGPGFYEFDVGSKKISWEEDPEKLAAMVDELHPRPMPTPQFGQHWAVLYKNTTVRIILGMTHNFHDPFGTLDGVNIMREANLIASALLQMHPLRDIPVLGLAFLFDPVNPHIIPWCGPLCR